MLSLFAGLGFATASIYVIRRRGFAYSAEWLLIAVTVFGIFTSLISAIVGLLDFQVTALVVSIYLILLLGFGPLGLLLANHPHARQMGLASLVGSILFIASRMVFSEGNGSLFAGVIALVLLVTCLFLLYQYQQQGKLMGLQSRYSYLMVTCGIALASSIFLMAGSSSLSLLSMAVGSWLAALLLRNSQLPDFRYILKTRQPSRIFQRLLGTSTYNPSRVLREFSLGISNITSPELLATVSIGLISEAVELNQGFLFSTDRETSLSGDTYRLQDVGGIGHLSDTLKTVEIQANNPIVQYFVKAHRPIRSEDLPGLPGFSSIAKTELLWFENLNMEVFAPVHTKEQWIGLICLGPKASGAAYNENDLELIETLADQLSLALQNARLIDSIMRVNNDFRRAYASMEQSNRQLQQAVNQLEKIDHTKSDFISVASHELRTPLTLIRGYTEMLLEEQSIQGNQFQARTVAGIYNGILRLQEILERMLDVASIDSRSFSLSKQPVSVSQLINSIQNKIKPILEERKLKLIVENISFLPIIEADGTALNKVFSNLINNAVKYTPDGGTVTISGVLVSPGQLGLQNGGIEIIIADTGIGIDPENLELIFNKFYQTGQISLHSSGKTKYRGSGPGLGLAIAKGLVEAHGGKIWAESKGYNEETFPGSQFCVVLPLSSKEPHDE